MRRSRTLVLAWIVAIAFLGGTILFLIDRLDIVAQPPAIPESAGLVDRVLGMTTYRQAIWPVYLLTNLLYVAGFVALIAFGGALAGAAAPRDQRPTFASLLTTGGILGAVSSIVVIGAVEAAVTLGYCDCVSRETEVVSQVWAEMVTMDIAKWLLRAAAVVLALGIVTLTSELRDVLSPTVRGLSYLLAIALIASPILAFVGRFDQVTEILDQIIAGVLVPVWAVAVGRNAAEVVETESRRGTID